MLVDIETFSLFNECRSFQSLFSALNIPPIFFFFVGGRYVDSHTVLFMLDIFRNIANPRLLLKHTRS